MFKVLTIFLSLQLILAPVAIAQSAGDQFRDGPAKNGGMDLYAKQILSLATSAVGANILTMCKLGKMVPSLMIFMGGSVVNIAGEIMAGKAMNENHKKRASSLKMLEEKMKQTPGGDLQKASLEEALKEEKETLAFINKRKMWALAVTAAYLGATAMSFIEKTPPPVGRPEWWNSGCMSSVAEGASGPSFTAKAIGSAYTLVPSLLGAGGDGGPISQYGGMIIALGNMTGILSGVVSKAYNTPIARSITFGAATVLQGLIVKGLMDRAKVTKENIEKLEKALAAFKDQTNTDNGIAQDGSSNSPMFDSNGAQIDPNSGRSFAINQLADGTTLPKECWSSTSKGMEYSSSACKSPVRLPSANFPAGINVPTLQSAAKLSNDLAQQVARGDIGAAEASASALGAQAGKLKQIRDNMAKQLNDQLKAKGEKPIDFEAESQKEAAQMMADFNKLSGSNSGLAALGSGSASDLDSALTGEADKKEETNVKTASGGAGIDVPSVTGGIITEGLVNDPSLNEGFLAANSNANVDYEYNENDVSERQDVSIFEQVSNRYMFQYNKLFSREKPKLEPVK